MLLKKLLGALLLPMPVAILLMAAGLALLWFTRRQRAGKVVATTGFALLLLFGLHPVGHALLAGTERGQEALHPAARLAALTTGAGRTPRWIVVLGATHVGDPRVPATDQLGGAALARLVEGVRLHRLLPEAKLVVSGGLGGAHRTADVMAEAALALGVPAAALVLDRTTLDTEDEAVKLGTLVGKDDFILVTSASHMPRALALFRARGLTPIPAPAEHLALSDEQGPDLGTFMPSPRALHRSHIALHEHLGRLWSRLRGRL